MNLARRRVLGLAILILSAFILLWGSWPAGWYRREIAIPARQIEPPEEGAVLLEIEWPRVLRAGDRGVMRLEAALDRSSRPDPGAATQPAGYNRLVEAHLELEGLLAEPDGGLTAPLKPGETTSLAWTLRPRRAGAYPGALWVHLRLIPLTARPGAEEARRVLTAQRLEIRAIHLLGLSGEQARLAGITGVVAGVMLFLETFLEGFWRRG